MDSSFCYSAYTRDPSLLPYHPPLPPTRVPFQLAGSGEARPSLIIAAFTCTHDAATVARTIHDLCPDVPMAGCTTCRGAVVNGTWCSEGRETGTEVAVSLWALSDEAGEFSVVHIENKHPSLTTSTTTAAATGSSLVSTLGDMVKARLVEACRLRDALPSFAVLLASPGDEETVLFSIHEVLGDDVPLIGGSSADNTVAGNWAQIAKKGSYGWGAQATTVSSDGIVIALGWASCEIATAICSGFTEDAGCRGVVTKVGETPRVIAEIDGRPAGDVYDEWTNGELKRNLVFDEDGRAEILASSSFMPLGEPLLGEAPTEDEGGEVKEERKGGGAKDRGTDAVHRVRDVRDGAHGPAVGGEQAKHFRVLHPAFLDSNTGAIETFANSAVGMAVSLLRGSPDTLTKKIAGSARALVTRTTDDYHSPPPATRTLQSHRTSSGKEEVEEDIEEKEGEEKRRRFKACHGREGSTVVRNRRQGFLVEECAGALMIFCGVS